MKILKLLCVSLMAVSLMFVGGSAAEIDFADCVGMWLFDEGRGGEAEDSSGRTIMPQLKAAPNGWMVSLTRL